MSDCMAAPVPRDKLFTLSGTNLKGLKIKKVIPRVISPLMRESEVEGELQFSNSSKVGINR